MVRVRCNGRHRSSFPSLGCSGRSSRAYFFRPLESRPRTRRVATLGHHAAECALASARPLLYGHLSWMAKTEGQISGRCSTTARTGSDSRISERPRQDSNLRHRLRRPVLYPLSYGGGFARHGGARKRQSIVVPAGSEPPSTCRILHRRAHCVVGTGRTSRVASTPRASAPRTRAPSDLRPRRRHGAHRASPPAAHGRGG